MRRAGAGRLRLRPPGSRRRQRHRETALRGGAAGRSDAPRFRDGDAQQGPLGSRRPEVPVGGPLLPQKRLLRRRSPLRGRDLPRCRRAFRRPPFRGARRRCLCTPGSRVSGEPLGPEGPLRTGPPPCGPPRRRGRGATRPRTAPEARAGRRRDPDGGRRPGEARNPAPPGACERGGTADGRDAANRRGPAGSATCRSADNGAEHPSLGRRFAHPGGDRPERPNAAHRGQTHRAGPRVLRSPRSDAGRRTRTPGVPDRRLAPPAHPARRSRREGHSGGTRLFEHPGGQRVRPSRPLPAGGGHPRGAPRAGRGRLRRRDSAGGGRFPGRDDGERRARGSGDGRRGPRPRCRARPKGATRWRASSAPA